MKNEKGITMIELLAAITIFFVVMGVGFAIFPATNLFFNQTQEEFATKSDQVLMNTIVTEYLSSPTIINYDERSSEKELKFTTFDQKNYSLLFDVDKKSIALYQSNSISLDSMTYDHLISTVENISDMNLTSQNGIYKLSVTYKMVKSNIDGEETVSEEKLDYSIKIFEMRKG
ncbi:prepilin-type N-terminal cleavage/methylation domain-containing protein [Bacillus timonensis]|uniref:prepilin-type N-terminal cleavage/methylation domain-containing protein n=1 Tax=Bacillus timonensis TaxID=1033734 RepID=UPI000289FF06|nr:prepilin-type N-terminal cleavage/methylation domain-containing protein [Bacillus timonensis]